jgi:hypothetical protein
MAGTTLRNRRGIVKLGRAYHQTFFFVFLAKKKRKKIRTWRQANHWPVSTLARLVAPTFYNYNNGGGVAVRAKDRTEMLPK